MLQFLHDAAIFPGLERRGLGLHAIAAFIAPHSECPHTTMFATFRTNTAYSIALASERSPIDIPSAVAGGIRLPTLRKTKSSPGSVEANRSGTTRLSEHVTMKRIG